MGYAVLHRGGEGDVVGGEFGKECLGFLGHFGCIQAVEKGEFPFQDGAALGEVAVNFDFEGGALGFECDIACLEFAQGVESKKLLSIHRPVAIQVRIRYPVFWNKLIVALSGESQAVLGMDKLHDGDAPIRQELRSQGAADQFRKFFPTERDVLLDLDCAHPVPATFGLHRKDKVDSSAVQTDIEFIDFYLTDIRHRGAEVILQGVGGDTGKDVHEAVITHQGQEGLFIIQGILGNDSRGGVRHLDADQPRIRLDHPLALGHKFIEGLASQLDHP